MKQVYVLTLGSYSDYHIIGVYSNLDDADKVNESLFESQCTIETYALNYLAEPAKNGFSSYLVEMARDGTVKSISKTIPIECSSPYMLHPKCSFVGEKTHTSKEKHLSCWKIAKNEQHAIKSTNELRAQLIANGEWE